MKLLLASVVLLMSSQVSSSTGDTVGNLSLFSDRFLVAERGYNKKQIEGMIQSRHTVEVKHTMYVYYDRLSGVEKEFVFCDNSAGSHLDCW